MRFVTAESVAPGALFEAWLEEGDGFGTVFTLQIVTKMRLNSV
jgi:hypothetical protein